MNQTYTGPYIVTPTESAKSLQTFGRSLKQNVIVSPIPADYVGTRVKRKPSATIIPTENAQVAVKKNTYTTGDVTVGPIPPDYVGSHVPIRTSADLTVSGATVTAPAGYYAATASKAIQDASYNIVQTNITPDISVDANGLVTSSKAYSTLKAVASSAGYAKTTDAVQFKANVSGTYQLPSAAYTLSTDERMAMVGSDTYWRVKPTINVSTGGYIAAGEVIGTGGSAYPYIPATTVTPSAAQQTIGASGSYMGGAVTVDPIPSQYYDMSGDNAGMGAGAELVTSFTLADVKLANTSFATWTPSTTAADILAARTAGTFSADLENYEYYIVSDTKIPVVTDDSAVKKALLVFTASHLVQNIARRPGTFANIQASSFPTAACLNVYTSNFLRYYGTTTNTITYTWGASYGLYATPTAATFSSTSLDTPTVTVKSPKVSARCSTTYMSTANAGLIDQDNTIISQSCFVYRVKKMTSFIRGIYKGQVALINDILGG